MDVYPRDLPTNFLFRGNMPVVNGSFAYSEIVMTMRGVAGKLNYTIPANFTLIDVRCGIVSIPELLFCSSIEHTVIVAQLVEPFSRTQSALPCSV